MAIFSKLSTKSARTMDRLSTIAAKAKAKATSRFPRGATVLTGIKLSATVASRLGSSVPYMQGIADAVDEIVAYADAMKLNRKQCKKIHALSEDLVDSLLAATEGVDEEDLSINTRLNLAELLWRLETICRTMQQMRKHSLVRRILSKDEHAWQLIRHQEDLQSAIDKFKMLQAVRMDLGITRIERKHDMVLEALGAYRHRARAPPRKPELSLPRAGLLLLASFGTFLFSSAFSS